MKPRLLDLYSGAGGAAVGYASAGFEVVGVDIEPQPDYPFEFVQADVTKLRQDILNGCWHVDGRIGLCLGTFDAVHASAPCQASCALTKGTNQGSEHPQLIPVTRELLANFDGPTVLENVQGSDLRRDLTLCGEMFNLHVIRHRYFEVSGFPVIQPAHVPHRGRVRGWRHGTYYDGPYVAVYGEGGGKGTVAEWQDAMGIDWTADRKAIAEAIPPQFTQYVGALLWTHLEAAA